MADISVVIPVWDDYVARLPSALASLLTQDVELEVIVVDNASTAPVPESLGATTIRLPRRTTVGVARNVGLAAVRTPLVCFLDADDELLPGTLRHMRARLATRPSCVASVAASVAWVEASGAIVDWRWPRPLAYRLCRFRRLFALTTALRNSYPTTSTLIRTDALRDAGGFADADHEEDWFPAVTLAARGGIDLDARPGRHPRISAGSLYGSGADLATMRDNRRALRQALRRDPCTRRLARVGRWPLAAFHLATAVLKARPRRRGHGALISAAAAAGHAAQGARQNGRVTPP